MKPSHSPRKGFTLIELLVVIGIIAILAAILFPVFSSVREKARQAKCQGNLHQIAIALKEYRADHGKYPPAPKFDDGSDGNPTPTYKYIGGLSALYPDYIKEKDLLICPDDATIKGLSKEAKDRNYSSYQGMVSAPSASDTDSWQFDTVDATKPGDDTTINGYKRTYNYWGFSQEGWDVFGEGNRPYSSGTLPQWLSNDKLRWRHFPRLSNRNAPDNTIICHCTHHRSHTGKGTSQMDIIITVGGSAKVVNVSQMSNKGSGAGDVSQWVSQEN